MEKLNFTKKNISVISNQTYGGRWYKVWFSIEVDTRSKYHSFSMSGIEGPLSSGNCINGCGQIYMHLKKEARNEWKYCKGYNEQKVDMLFDIWGKYHLQNIDEKPLPSNVIQFLNDLPDETEKLCYVWR